MKHKATLRDWWSTLLLLAVALLALVGLFVFGSEPGLAGNNLVGIIFLGVIAACFIAGLSAPVRRNRKIIAALLGVFLAVFAIFLCFAIAVYLTHGRKHDTVLRPQPEGSPSAETLHEQLQPGASFEFLRLSSDDTVTQRTQDDASLIDIHSRTGIGSVTIKPPGGSWPKKVTLRLHLRGLEQLRLLVRQDELTASMSSNRQPMQLMELKPGDQPAETLTNKSPYWTDMRMLGDDGQPRTEIPLQDGYFEFDIPPLALNDNPPQIVVNWIDFYR